MHRTLALLSLLGGLTLAAPTAQAAVFTVATTADAPDASAEDGLCSATAAGGLCTLRAAIGQAQVSAGADRIVVPAGSYDLLQGLGELSVASTVTIEGAGARTTVIKAATGSRVMTATGNLVLRDVTLTGGAPESSGALRGGGLHVTAGDTTLERVTVSGNTVTSATNAHGGGVAASGGSLTILDSTIAGNTAVGRLGNSGGGSAGGGGVAVAAPTDIRRSTITGNITRSFGAGQFSSGGGVSAADELTLEHVTIAGNTASAVADSSGFKQGGNLYVQGSGIRAIGSSILSGGAASQGSNCFIASGALTELSRNLVSNADCLGASSLKNVNPQLGALASDGGPTDTLRPSLASAAVDAASSCGTRPADQRGGALPAGVACDLGAVELGGDRAMSLQASKLAPAAGDDVTVVGTIANDGPDATTGEVVTIDLPAGTTATTATSTVGSCTAGASVTCAIGTLADGAAATFIVTIRASGDAGVLTARRTGPLPDPSAANDTAKVELGVGPVKEAVVVGAGSLAGTGASAQDAPPASPGPVGPAVSALRFAGKPTVRRGAKVAFALSVAATATVTVERLLPGRLSGAACKAKGRGKRCTRAVRLHRRSLRLPAGPAVVVIPGKRLQAGKVRVSVVAASGWTSSTPALLTGSVKRR